MTTARDPHWLSTVEQRAAVVGDDELVRALRRARDNPAATRLLLHNSRVQAHLREALARQSDSAPAIGRSLVTDAARGRALAERGLGAELAQLRHTWHAVLSGGGPPAELAAQVLAVNPELSRWPAPPAPDDPGDESGWSRR